MGEACGKQVPPSCPAKPAVQVPQAGTSERAAGRTSGSPVPAQPTWVGKSRLLYKVVTVSRGALDPGEPNAEKAAEATFLLTSRIALPEISQEAAHNAGT